MLRRLLSFVFLAGCAIPQDGAQPTAARISSDGVRITLSDGRVCRGGTPPGGERRWTGPLQGCPEGWRYVVRLDERTNPARFIVEAVLTALTIEDALAEIGEVTVIDASGLTTVLTSPPPRQN